MGIGLLEWPIRTSFSRKDLEVSLTNVPATECDIVPGHLRLRIIARLAHAVTFDLAHDGRGSGAQLFGRQTGEQIAQKVRHRGRFDRQVTVAEPHGCQVRRVARWRGRNDESRTPTGRDWVRSTPRAARVPSFDYPGTRAAAGWGVTSWTLPFAQALEAEYNLTPGTARRQFSYRLRSGSNCT
jgi:hypothetical protein